jgi:hypothetical protein
VVEHRRRHQSAVHADPLGAHDDIAGTEVGDDPARTIAHQDPRLTAHAVVAGMAAAPEHVDRVAEGQGVVVAEGVDDPLGAHVEELEAAVLADADLALEHRLLQQRALRLVASGDLPAEPLDHDRGA